MPSLREVFRLTATSDPPAMKILLLATNGSEEAELAAWVAVELAGSTGSELHLVHVMLLSVTPPYPEVLDWREDLEPAG